MNKEIKNDVTKVLTLTCIVLCATVLYRQIIFLHWNCSTQANSRTFLYFWTRKQKYLHLQEISCLPLYSFYSIKLSCQNSNYLLMVLQHTQTFLFGLNNRGVGQITSNVVTFQWM